MVVAVGCLQGDHVFSDGHFCWLTVSGQWGLWVVEIRDFRLKALVFLKGCGWGICTVWPSVTWREQNLGNEWQIWVWDGGNGMWFCPVFLK